MEQVFTPGAALFLQTLAFLLLLIVLFLAAVFLLYALRIIHNLYSISKIIKEGGQIIRKDFLGFLERAFTDDNIKTALLAFWSWGNAAYKKIKGNKTTKKTTRKRKVTSSKKSTKSKDSE